MKKLLLALALLLCADIARAETCAFTASGNWSAVGTYSGTHSCVVGGLSADDDLTVNSGVTVTVTGSIGTAGVPRTGTLTVASGGILSFNSSVNYFSTNGIVFNSGSCPSDACDFTGSVLQKISAPTITYPSATTIAFDFDALLTAGNVLPWTLCTAACGASDIHTAAAATNGVATYIYVGWTKLGKDMVTQLTSDEQLMTDFVDAPGLWLEVTAVDAVAPNLGFTVTLPTLPANTTAYHYAVAEAVSAGVLQNIVGGVGWTVGSVVTRENNMGQVRYETLIDAADAPFNADHEFEGYLACKQGTDRCLRMTETESGYGDDFVEPGAAIPAGSEMFVTWKNPGDTSDPYWTAGDQLDIYYARIDPGDTLIPINPIRFDFTGSLSGTQSGNQSFKVRGGSGLNTITAVVFQDANMANDAAHEGAISMENYATSDNTKTLSYVLAEGCNAGSGVARVIGVAGSTLPACIRIQDRDGEGATGVGVRNVRWSDVSIRFPQEVIDFTTNPLSDGFGYAAVQMTESTGESISNAANVTNGTVVDWTNNSLRKMRVEGFTTGFGTATTGYLKNCPDTAFMQDILILHSRSRKGDDSGANMANYARRGEDQLETFGHTPSCGVDRFVIGGSNVGTSFGPLRHARLGLTQHTSFVVFGGSGKVNNETSAWTAGSRPYINYAFVHNNTTGPEGHTHSFPGAGSDGIAVYNFLTDGATGYVSQAYFQKMGWFRQTLSQVQVNCGQFTVGGVWTGATRYTGQNSVLPCDAPFTTVKIWDNYWINHGRDFNNEVSQDCTTAGAASGTSVYPCVGSSGAFNPMIASNNNNVTPLPTYDIRRNFFHRGDRAGANTGYWIEIQHTDNENSSFYFKDNTFITSAGTFNYPILFRDDRITSMTMLNTWSEGGATLNGCRQTGGSYAATTADGCDFTAAGGLDYSTDDSPHAAFNLYLAGDVTNFKDMRPVGAAGSYTGDPTIAYPQYAGLVAWEWPHAWATPSITVIRRGNPLGEFVPTRLRSRMSAFGGSGGANFSPVPFGR